MDFSNYFFNLVVIGGGYLLISGLAFIIFYVFLKNILATRKIQKKFPERNDYLRELGHTILTVLIFALFPLIFFGNQSIRSHTLLYSGISDYGLVYFILSFLVLLFLHDSYFSLAHRLMHKSNFLWKFHLTHHKSTNPNPLTSFSFHPIEAIIQAGAFVLFAFLFPIHEFNFLALYFLLVIYNVYGHLGWEIFPRKLTDSRFGKYLNTSTKHNIHHKKSDKNFGLYFTFWDDKK